RGPGRPHADLFGATVSRLLAAGMDRGMIDGEPLCTASDDRFFSHRRTSGRTGRHLAGISGITRNRDSTDRVL
ncbi:MAG: laccase domain-containing protein, partial [Phycisphaeraceae bacterium]|nr:laccase domain-containing protein [Phycisphaeraceae bacterium]